MSEQHAARHDTYPLRSPQDVMRLARLGAFHQTRLSFMRALLRRLKTKQWRFSRRSFDIDSNGVGVATYTARGEDHTYTLICFAHDLPDELRSDRVIAEAWDATFTLFDGEPTAADIERLAENVPKQEAGRCTQKELVLSRANKSVRLFNHVVQRLSEGRQPDVEKIDDVGYLMRTTAVYGNGKFGLSDRERVANREALSGPFRAELLSVWLIRAFTVDWVEHLARLRAPATACALSPSLARRLGIGNSTGLGMAPFIVNHPALLHNWIVARETALARVLAIPHSESADTFSDLLNTAQHAVQDWHTDDALQAARIVTLTQDLARLAQHVADGALRVEKPWAVLHEWAAEHLGVEAQELLVSLVIEPHGDLVDDLADQMAADESNYFAIDGSVTVKDSLANARRLFDWCLHTDFNKSEHQARFWYVSEEKLEPRLGERFEEPGAEKEQPLAVARDVCALVEALKRFNAAQPIAGFLLAHPEHRDAVRRLQTLEKLPYAEIRDNLLDASMRPIDLLRCKLSFFGATRFDPRSDRWVRITMFQGAPFPHELSHKQADDWVYTRPFQETG